MPPTPGGRIFMILVQILGFWAAGVVPQAAHRDFLPIPGLKSSKSLTSSPIVGPQLPKWGDHRGEPYLDELPIFPRICLAQKVRMDREMISGVR